MRNVQSSDASRRRDRIKLLLQTMVDNREKILSLITEARDGDDHLALGFKSWPEYVSTEFGGLLAQLTREDRREAVLALSATGMSTRAIAPIVGASDITVRRDLAGATYVAPEPDYVTDEADAEFDGDLSRRHVAECLTPKSVVGLDGKTYTATTKSSRRRKPLPDAFHDATYDLSRIATRLENLHQDDRFAGNREALRRHRADLFRAQTILRRLIADLGDDDQGALL